ncbi:MAG: tripartite tricarboxylate transporter substrate binding protein [Polaromonas sp.]|uniref:Bug family tripartite tricarboxylate transporter substrate binding protein n=1 Tax=Polaromonas sp. TaxID=1869339 RepID=UPI0025F6D681|nr:tripartite tricarboxylate transporter substrate binding protein [Polaromonas sp.]MBI2726767.1 tripartite tricarboxylate transporter substrate binding protein [Polaromonas sp.]
MNKLSGLQALQSRFVFLGKYFPGAGTRLRALARILVILISGGISGLSHGKPIELVVPYAAGGFTDAIARHVADALSKKWGEPVVVVNKTGAASVVGIRYAIDQGGVDGRTILLGSLGYITTQFQSRGAPFDVKALVPVVYLGSTPSVLYIRSNIPATNYREFAEWARKKADGVAFGTSGVASSPHLNAEELAAMSGFKLLSIPYPGSSASIPAMAGGHIDAVFESSGSRSMAETGKIRALMVGSEKPLASWPELPTAEAAGLKGFRSGSWFGLFLPAKTPPELQARLGADVNAVLASPQLQETFRQMDFISGGGRPEAFVQFLEAEKAKLGALIKSRNIRVD